MKELLVVNDGGHDLCSGTLTKVRSCAYSGAGVTSTVNLFLQPLDLVRFARKRPLPLVLLLELVVRRRLTPEGGKRRGAVEVEGAPGDVSDQVRRRLLDVLRGRARTHGGEGGLRWVREGRGDGRRGGCELRGRPALLRRAVLHRRWRRHLDGE